MSMDSEVIFINDFMNIKLHPNLRNTNPHWPKRIPTRFLYLYDDQIKKNYGNVKNISDGLTPLEIYAVINRMTMIEAEYDFITDEEAMEIITQEIERWDNAHSKDTCISKPFSQSENTTC